MALTQAQLFENVVMKLSVLRYVVRARSKRSLTDLNRQCESFFRDVLNLVYGTNLVNLNDTTQNAVAIDLGDKGARLCFQVTSTSSSKKVQDTIDKFLKHSLNSDYDTLKVLILGEKTNHTKTFNTQGKVSFDKKQDIIDVDDVLEAVEKLALEKLRALSDYVDVHLHPVTASLSPQSLLAQAEKIENKPPKSAQRFLREAGISPTEPEWTEAFEAMKELHAKLLRLSVKQRDFIRYIVENGVKSVFGQRMSIGIQTLQQKLRLTDLEFESYFIALSDQHLIEVDDEDHATRFEVRWQLIQYVDAFYTLHVWLTSTDQYDQLFGRCDFTVLD